jgi:peroxiredoxin
MNMKKRILAAAAVLLIVLTAWLVMQKDSPHPNTVPPDKSLNQPGAAPGSSAEEDGAPELTDLPGGGGEEGEYGVYPGDRAFVFELADLEGNTFRLSDYRERVVLLCFWQTTCSWCQEGLPLMDQLYKTYKDGDVTVLAINVGEDREEVSQFVSEKGFTFPVLLDTDAEVSKKYLVSYLPTNYVINQRGEISAVHIGLMEYDQMVGYIEAAFKE